MNRARALTIFLGAVRARSFSGAAVEQGITPQAVSKAVRNLEAELGVTLFHRTTRRLLLTPDGARLVDLAEPGIREFERALATVRSSTSDNEGVIRLTAPRSVATGIVVPLIRRFRAEYPGITFDVLVNDQFTDLVEAKIDIGFRTGNRLGESLIARKLCNLPLTICASPDYLTGRGAPQDLAELARHHCMAYRRPSTGRIVPWELTIDGTNTALDVPPTVTFNDVEAELQAVRAGMGIGQLFTYMIEDDLRAGRLISVLPQYRSPHVELYLYYQHRTHVPARVRRFIDFVTESSRTSVDGLDGLRVPR